MGTPLGRDQIPAKVHLADIHLLLRDRRVNAGRERLVLVHHQLDVVGVQELQPVVTSSSTRTRGMLIRHDGHVLEHDLIVFQHPLYWYSSPALLKEWQDCVLLPNFAFPPGVGDKLKGKHWLSVITVGSSEDDYRAVGSNKYTIDEFLRPFEQTAAFCGMIWVPPVVVDKVVPAKIVDTQWTIDENLQKQAEQYRSYFEGYSIELRRLHAIA